MNKKFEVMLRDEEYSIGLRRLFESFGYKKFKMRKFEKYELYLENKSFLRNGNIITVTDPKGRLLAMWQSPGLIKVGDPHSRYAPSG